MDMMENSGHCYKTKEMRNDKIVFKLFERNDKVLDNSEKILYILSF